MELPMTLAIAGLIVNRLVEIIKKVLPAEGVSQTADRWREAVILSVSFVVGAALVTLLFPSENMFPDAISPLVGQIFTGVLVGGFANGWDFLAGAGESLIKRTTEQQTTTIERQSSVSVSSPAPHDMAAAG